MELEIKNRPGLCEKIPNADKIILATNFLYENYVILSEGVKREDCDTDGIRGDLALELLGATLEKGIRVVVCDGGSSPDFLSCLERFENKGLAVVNSDIQARAPQRRKAFETASSMAKGKAIVYTQPEKVSLVDNLAEISQPILEGNADIVIPKREEELFKSSYPEYMWQSELRVNKIYDFMLRKKGYMKKGESFDWFFGALVFKNDPEIVSIFLKKYKVEGLIYSRIGAVADPEKNSGSHYFPIVDALSKGKCVISVEVPFIYPESQKRNELCPEKISEFRKKRRLNANAYPMETLHLLQKGDKRSKIRELQDTVY